MIPVGQPSNEGTPRGLAKGHCTVCSALIEFQNRLIGYDQSTDPSGLCHHHAWEIARIAPAERAAQIFQHLVGASRNFYGSEDDHPCDLCKKVQDQEQTVLVEIVLQLTRMEIPEWGPNQGSLCIKHAKQLASLAPDDIASLIMAANERSRIELLDELQALLVRRARGDRAGWGVLGRAAEFLRSQRGLAR